MKILHRIFPFLLLAYHLAFAWVGCEYILTHHGDAERYWFLGQDLSSSFWTDFLKPGTDVVRFLTFPLVKFFGMPFWGGFFIFSLLSFSGIALLYRTLMQRAGDSPRHQLLVMVLMLLPNFHFWTSLIGKEAVLIIPIALFIREVSLKKYFSFLLLGSVFFIALIRPHIAFILLLSYVLSLLWTLRLPNRSKAIILGGFFAATALFAFLLTRLQDFSGGFQRVLQKYEAHIRHFKTTDGYIPLDEYQLPYKIFTFWFRPLPFEKVGVLYTVLSIENMFLLLLSVWVAVYVVKYFHVLKNRMLFVLPVVFVFIFSLMYVYAYANYGIIMRTRVMAVPFLYLLFMEVFDMRISRNYSNT